MQAFTGWAVANCHVTGSATLTKESYNISGIIPADSGVVATWVRWDADRARRMETTFSSLNSDLVGNNPQQTTSTSDFLAIQKRQRLGKRLRRNL